MFRLQRHSKSSESGERIDFKFSNFQALQVPNGWEKLFVSIVSVETGKTVAKSTKALVRNGNCQWTDTLSESLWISQDDSSKDIEERLFKLVVSMGSARSGILGEATLNMANYMSSRASAPVSLPLKKCNHGTILQAKIHCLTPRTKLREKDSKYSNTHVVDQDADCDDIGNNSNGSVDSFAGSLRSPSSQDLGTTSHPGKFGSPETSYSASASNHSFNSANGSIGKENFSPRNDVNGDRYSLDGIRDAASAKNNSHGGNFPVDDPYMSNHSSFNSRVMGSRDDFQNHGQEFGQYSLPAIATSSLTNTGSSKNLLEAAEDTIEELRNEAKMWERNARTQMLDLDILRSKFSVQSKKLADLEMELSAACTERDGMNKEVEQLKLLLEQSMVKQRATEDSTFQSEGIMIFQKELEDEIKFQQESNANLALQLTRTQESNIELVSVLQELEETIEKQKVEIDNLSILQLKFNDFEKSIQVNLEENKNLSFQLQQLQESEKTLQVDVQLLQQALEDKNNELVKELSLNSQSLLDIEREYKCKLSAKEEEIANLEAKLSESLSGRHLEEMGSTNGSPVDLIREIEALKEEVQELERDCSELTNENLEILCKLKESRNNCNCGGASFDSSSSELPDKSNASTESEMKELKSQIYPLEEEINKKVFEEDRLTAFETSNLFCELFEQLEIAFHQVKKPWYNISSDANDELKSYLDNLGTVNKTDITASKVSAESIINCLVELNKLLEERISECEEVLKSSELDIKERNNTIAEAQKLLKDHILKFRELESSKMDLQSNLADQEKEVADKISEVEKLKANFLSKEEEIDFLRQCRMELEVQVSDLTKEKDQLQENMEIALRESSITSKCLDDLRNDLKVLSTSVDSHVSANKTLERKSAELESGKRELELHLFEVEEENVQLSERISGLEAQLRYITDERESTRLELENSKSIAMGLQDEIGRLKIELETQKVALKQKLHDMENRWLEAQAECERLTTGNQKLQASAERLIEECNTLQKLNGELRKQKLELHEHCTHLETELRESRKCLSDCSKRVEVLEENLSSMLENFALKEKTLTSELNALLQENRKQKEKLILEESLLNQMYLEKTAEVENIQREVEHLTEQISATHDERERIASEAVREVSSLRADNAKLESAFQEVHSRVKLAEDELDTVRIECELKVQGVMVELAASKQSHEILMADQEKKLKLLANYRSNEEKLKTAVNNLELKLTVSDYERQQLIEETANLKAQLQKIAHLQDEVLALKRKLNESKFEKEKLESSLRSIAEDYEELKAEKISYVEKISSFQKAMSEFDDGKCKIIALEEKLLRMQGDLTAKEALCAQETELRNELSQIKRANKQYQRKIQQLEEEKDECLKRSQALQEDLRLMEAAKQDRSKFGSKKAEILRSTNQDLDNRRKPSARTSQAQELLADQQNSNGSQYQIEDDNEYGFHGGSPFATGVDRVTKVQSLDNVLAEDLEANNKYKTHLQRYLSEGQNSISAAPRKSKAEGEARAKERFERTQSSLETELRDIRDRYFQMSLKYAEVEAQREDLVMMLKAAKRGKRWLA